MDLKRDRVRFDETYSDSVIKANVPSDMRKERRPTGKLRHILVETKKHNAMCHPTDLYSPGTIDCLINSLVRVPFIRRQNLE
eukprot:gene14484-17123_t